VWGRFVTCPTLPELLAFRKVAIKAGYHAILISIIDYFISVDRQFDSKRCPFIRARRTTDLSA
jgi:hypothetical protein